MSEQQTWRKQSASAADRGVKSLTESVGCFECDECFSAQASPDICILDELAREELCGILACCWLLQQDCAGPVE